ncbi:MAG: PEP-CTERM sorting domain-containing protein [Planctomycetota bacterium]
MKPSGPLTSTVALVLTAGLAASTNPAAAQSDPAGFDFVFNIGNVPPGSIFEITDADIPGTLTTGTQVGDGNFTEGEVFITPTSLGGDTLNSNSQFNLFDGGDILLSFSAGPTDGTGSNIEVNISGGSVGDFFDANAGSEVNISGGSVGFVFEAKSGSTVNISGGTVGGSSDAESGSTVNISGGTVGSFFDAESGSAVNLSGGTVGIGFDAESGSTVNLSGGEFRLNGSPISDLSGGFGFGTGNNDLFTGLLTDGSVFIFAGEASDSFFPGSTNLTTDAVAPSANPGVLASGTFTQGLREGESLTVTGTGTLGANFAVVDGTLNIEGGSVGNGLEIVSGEINLSGGTVGNFSNAFTGSTVNISGGTVGDSFEAFSGSTVNISGGIIEFGFDAESGSTVNISGGTIGDNFGASSGSTVNLSGGTVGDGFLAFSGSTVNLFGTSFVLDGAELTDLTLGEAFTITGRGVTLSGFLADGSAFEFELNIGFAFDQDLFAPDATLTITLVPEPTSILLLGLGGLLTARRRRV